MSVTNAERVRVARAAVAAACRVCRAVGRDLEGAGVTKDDRSPVTVADFASQAVVIRALRDAFADVPIVAEETSDMLRSGENTALLARVVAATRIAWPGADADAVLDAIDGGGDGGGGGSFWTLDPIDGTKGFLRGGQYAVSLAYLEDGAPVLGALGCPHLSSDFARPFDEADPHGLIYSAAIGDGVLAGPADVPDTAPQPLTALADPGAAIRCVESVERAHSARGNAGRILERAGLASTRLQADSQAKYAIIARGQANLMLRVPTDPTRKELIWDHAAGAVVAQAAGMKVSDLRGAPLDFSRGRALERNYGVVCAHPSVHRRIIAAAVELGVAEPPAS